MANQRIGILHPGEMGIFVAASAKNSGCDVYWTPEGRLSIDAVTIFAAVAGIVALLTPFLLDVVDDL